jgi:Integrase core domain
MTDMSAAAREPRSLRELSFLLSPRIRKRLRESGDSEIGWRDAVGDRRNDARRHEGERRQKADLAFAKRFTLSDLDEGRDTTEPEVFDPSAGLGDGGEHSIADLGLHGGLGGGFMHDPFHGNEVRSRPGQHERGRGRLARGGRSSQFTSAEFTSVLINNGISISMDGKGAWRDNVFVERFWRTIKYEQVYLHAYDGVGEARQSIGCYIAFYNTRRPHTALDGRTPDQAYFDPLPLRTAA